MTNIISDKTDWETNKEIQIFREYLRIPSVHPNVDYGKFYLQLIQKALIKLY